ncbi:MAG: Fe-S cluster assembly protein SufD [Flavobacteriales bacterium]|nr:Fe-S cluster assembly protein SufD [Flavobacteriales bacterium]MCB9446731.1 Fe-S cluster assembly protein SufD [Flavobacteriales bacterium]
MSTATATSSQEEKKKAFIDGLVRSSAKALPVIADEARKALPDLQLPNRKTEAWKYTPITALLKKTFEKADNQPADLKALDVPFAQQQCAVVSNGALPAGFHVEQDGIFIGGLSEALKQHGDLVRQHLGSLSEHKTEIFAALNTLHASDVTVLIAPDGCEAEAPVYLTQAITGAYATSPRYLVIAGKNSKINVVITQASTCETGFTNSVTEAIVAENAELNICYLQQDQGLQVYQTWLSQARDSRGGVHTFTLAGQLVRNNVYVQLNGRNIESHLNGLYLTQDGMHVDNHTVVDHRQPDCMSDELYKGVLDGKSTGVFNGKVFVRPHAQKTNAFQSNRNILLSDQATVNSKPELEIYADDVKCSHGSTTGRLDEEAIFYLRSRGIGADRAMRLMLQAFGEEVLERIPFEEVKTYVHSKLETI